MWCGGEGGGLCPTLPSEVGSVEKGQIACIQILIMLLPTDTCTYVNSEMVALKKNDKWNNLERISLLQEN